MWSMYAVTTGERIAIDQFAELPDSQRIGRDLGGDVGQVVVDVARRIGPGEQQLPQLVLARAGPARPV